MMSTSENAGSNGPVWRPASVIDIDAIEQVAGLIHPHLPERRDVLAEKLALFPMGCFVLVRRETVMGYGLAHRWILDSIPPLDAFLEKVPSHADCLYIHDVALLLEVRGYGSGQRYIRLMVECARKIGVDFLALVSVYDNQPFWAKRGFEIVSAPELGAKLRSYGPTAQYLTLKLTRS
jgi:GNAT superfamily N-acetyltransferase